MPPRKRKVVEEASSVDDSSGLSSPLSQGDLVLESEEANPTAAKKRKIGQGGRATATSGRVARASARNTVKKEVDIEVKEEDRDAAEVAEENKSLKPTSKRQPRKKVEVKEEEIKAKEDEAPATAAVANPAKKKRKTKEEKEAEAMPLAARTIGHKLFIGAHVSSAGGQYFFRIQLYRIDSMHTSPAPVFLSLCFTPKLTNILSPGVQNAPINSVHIGANAFALFLKSQRKWVNPPLLTEAVDGWKANCKHHNYEQNKHVVPHGSYLVNLAHVDPTRTKQALDSFVDDLQRCEKLGIKLYNFHPGVANSTDKASAIAHLASNINRAHAQTSTVVTLLENMAAGGNVLGSALEDLSQIIELIDDKSRVGVCLDTCHAFAAGYDLRSPEAFSNTMAEFERVVGVKYLRAVHVNDSKAPFASHRDLHANIGTGFLGLRAFHNLVNDSRFEGLPLILETPIEVRDADGQVVKDDKGKVKEDKGIWATEIKLLEGLVGMDVGGDEFKRLEAELARKGKPERERLQEQNDKKREKEAAKEAKAGKKKTPAKGKKVKKETESDDESELSDVKSESP